ncbi:MAG: hypothetical protein KAS72_00635 [Phycisphaerales bacterium]|nr:hypothetical protein [Phycisphaerales bacterium]
MTGTSVQSGSGPLSTEEFQIADRAARRMHGELRSLLAHMPVEARTASGLARHLQLDRTTCQRAVSVAREPSQGPEIISRLPGIPGLRQIVAAARDLQGDRPSDDVLASLQAAIDGYERLIHRLAGSQTKLVGRLSATPLTSESEAFFDTAASVGRFDAYTRQLFESAAKLTGRYSEVWVAIYAYRPHPKNRDRLIVSRAYGLVGHRARPDAVPLVIHNFSTPNCGSKAQATGISGLARGFEHLDERAIESGSTPEVVIPEFTSSPLPLISSKQPGAFLVQSVDADGENCGKPFDLMLASRAVTPHPRTQSPAAEETWAMVNFPVRHLLFDVYLHQDLATCSIAGLDVHLWRPDFATSVADRWQTRFTRTPKLVMLGRGIEDSASSVFARHAELTRLLFAQTDEDPHSYIGHRCEITHPMWRTGYCMTFDFGAGNSGH